MIVADSDYLIDFLRGRGEGARRVELELGSASFATTSITAFELRSGARTATHRRDVETLLAALTILPFGEEEARLAADIRQQVEAQGRPIGMADYLVAATCIATDSVLLTRNRKPFERVPGLRLGARPVPE